MTFGRRPDHDRSIWGRCLIDVRHQRPMVRGQSCAKLSVGVGTVLEALTW